MSTKAAGERLLSLDAFRGATIAGMILVNNSGDYANTWWPLLHQPWHGWTPTDLIFPFFLWMVGVSLVFSRRIGSTWAPSCGQAPGARSRGPRPGARC